MDVDRDHMPFVGINALLTTNLDRLIVDLLPKPFQLS
jgi:hypothetical protein